MSDTTITPEERELWTSCATARINAVTPERQCEITAQERLVKSLAALEAADARAEKAEGERKNTDVQFSKVRLDNALLRTRSLTAEAEVARLTAERDWLASELATVSSTDEDGRYVLTCPNSKLRAVGHDCGKIACPQCWAEAARKAVSAGEGK